MTGIIDYHTRHRDFQIVVVTQRYVVYDGARKRCFGWRYNLDAAKILADTIAEDLNTEPIKTYRDCKHCRITQTRHGEQHMCVLDRIVLMRLVPCERFSE